MKNIAAVLTISDKGFCGERTDTAGPAIREMLESDGFQVVHSIILPDEKDQIAAELIRCTDQLHIPLILTVGGTGFSPRDVTPEATKSVIERDTPGIPEQMRAESHKYTDRACLSRATAGIRGHSLIVNLPGSEKAAKENLSAVLHPLKHGLEMLLSEGSADCAAETLSGCARILAVCISDRKGEQKHSVEVIQMRPDWGIVGDAHAGNWHRQISILGSESVDTLSQKLGIELEPGAFAENVLAEGICFFRLPVGTRLKIGTALCEVTQIGKECHNDCAIRKQAGDCVMPREGIFVKVLKAGEAREGDKIEIIP